eukprot:3186089-Amphidinium_carterae.1
MHSIPLATTHFHLRPPGSRFTSSVKRIGPPQPTATYYHTINCNAQKSPRTALIKPTDSKEGGIRNSVIYTETLPITSAARHNDRSRALQSPVHARELVGLRRCFRECERVLGPHLHTHTHISPPQVNTQLFTSHPPYRGKLRLCIAGAAFTLSSSQHDQSHQRHRLKGLPHTYTTASSTTRRLVSAVNCIDTIRASCRTTSSTWLPSDTLKSSCNNTTGGHLTQRAMDIYSNSKIVGLEHILVIIYETTTLIHHHTSLQLPGHSSLTHHHTAMGNKQLKIH